MAYLVLPAAMVGELSWVWRHVEFLDGGRYIILASPLPASEDLREINLILGGEATQKWS